jgi:hypothetical protein
LQVLKALPSTTDELRNAGTQLAGSAHGPVRNRQVCFAAQRIARVDRARIAVVDRRGNAIDAMAHAVAGIDSVAGAAPAAVGDENVAEVLIAIGGGADLRHSQALKRDLRGDRDPLFPRGQRVRRGSDRATNRVIEIEPKRRAELVVLARAIACTGNDGEANGTRRA